jgi:hypothetical protein
MAEYDAAAPSCNCERCRMDRVRAAAPEMLEALVKAEACVWPLTGHGDATIDAHWRSIRAAIAKATGGAQ